MNINPKTIAKHISELSKNITPDYTEDYCTVQYSNNKLSSVQYITENIKIAIYFYSEVVVCNCIMNEKNNLVFLKSNTIEDMNSPDLELQLSTVLNNNEILFLYLIKELQNELEC